MMMSEVVVLGNFISVVGIQVYPSNIKVISNIPIPRSQKEVRIFLDHASYYSRFIEKKFKLESPLFTLIMKDAQFVWTDTCHETFS